MRSKVTFWRLAAGALALAGLVFACAFGFGHLANPRDRELPAIDVNQLTLVSLDQPLAPGKPLADGQWADAATEGIRQDDLLVRVDSVKAGQLPEKGPVSYVLVNFRLAQIRLERKNAFQGFASAQHRPLLTDSAGRSYAFHGHRRRKPFPSKFEVSLYVDEVLIFELPPSSIDSLKLEVPASAWGRQGTCRFHFKTIEREAAPEDAPKQIAQYKAMLHTPAPVTPDAALGRQIFSKACMECHTLHGIGSKVGPDLTDLRTPDGRLKRGDVDFLVTNIVNPSAEIAKEYQPSIVTTTAGLVIIGIVKQATPQAVTLQTSSKLVDVLKKDIEDMRESKVSLMPVDLLKELDEHKVRSLFAYLGGKTQAPLLASHENIGYFFTGKDFAFWRGAGSSWKLDRGEIVSSGGPGGELLTSDVLLPADVHLTLQFHPGKEGRAAIQFSGEASPAAAVPRVELAAGGRVVVTAKERSLAPQQELTGANLIQADTWNKLELILTGQRIGVRLNGKDAVTEEDAGVPARGLITLAGSAIAGQEIRFRNLDARLLSPKKR